MAKQSNERLACEPEVVVIPPGPFISVAPGAPEGGCRRRSVPRRRRAAARARRRSPRSSAAVGTSSASAVGVDQPEATVGPPSRARACATPSGVFGADRRAPRRRGASAASQVAARAVQRGGGWRARRAARRTSSTTSVMMQPAPGSSGVRPRYVHDGLEAVVAVGEHERVASTAAADRRDLRRGRRRAQSSWTAPSSSTRARGGRTVGRAAPASPTASEMPQIGSRLARVARSSSSRSDLAFGSVRSCGSTPPSVERERADHAGRRDARAVVAVEGHAVHREASASSGTSVPSACHAAQRRGGLVVRRRGGSRRTTLCGSDCGERGALVGGSITS